MLGLADGDTRPKALGQTKERPAVFRPFGQVCSINLLGFLIASGMNEDRPKRIARLFFKLARMEQYRLTFLPRDSTKEQW